MSRKPSFEEALRQKMTEVPLPDENESWQKMNALLDEKEKRRGFFFFRNEKIISGALLFCALLLWLVLSLQTEKKSTHPVIQKNDIANRTNKTSNQEDKKITNEKTRKKSKEKQAYSDTDLSSSTSSSVASASSLRSRSTVFEKSNNIKVKQEADLTKKKAVAIGSNVVAGRKKTQQNNNSAFQKQDDKITASGTPERGKQPSFITDSSRLITGADSLNLSSSAVVDSNRNIAVTKSNFQKTDSASANNAAAKANIKIKHHDTYFIDGGIGIKQQLPVDSQRFAGYNYNGHQSSLGDYIPYLYIKLEKEKRWFLQGEFHYAAPRLINPVAYWQKTKADYGHGNTTTERYYLQKTWYTEVPVSVNIYLRPAWSVGAGAMYSQLRGASAKKETTVYDAISGQYTVTSEQIPWRNFTDSFLYKTNTSLLLQTDYQLSKWSFGIRYLHDMQPFLTYTLPDGEKKDKRNTSLELLIRYRLYRSDKFRIGKL